jgi:RNA polymerase-binding transcription factor DksA
MAVGWAHDGAVQEQIDASIADAIERARDRLAVGESLAFREDCGEPIREALPGVRRCITSQVQVDAQRSTLATTGAVARTASSSSAADAHP